jgi:hypothetical protein
VGGILKGEAFTKSFPSFPTFIRIHSFGGWEDSTDVLSCFVHLDLVTIFNFLNFEFWIVYIYI